MKYWEIIADRLHEEGWSYGIAEHFRDEKRFIVKSDDLLTAFLSLERDVTELKVANENAAGQNVA
jgi:hypothetical protein